MKKLILIIAIVCSGMLLQAQLKGIYLSNATKATESISIDDTYNQLFIADSLYLGNFKWSPEGVDSLYIINYKLNTVGVVQSHRQVMSILDANNVDFDTTFKNDSYLSSDVDGYDDYESIPYSVRSGNSIISMGWIVDEYALIWLVTDEGMIIMIIKTKEFYKQ